MDPTLIGCIPLKEIKRYLFFEGLLTSCNNLNNSRLHRCLHSCGGKQTADSQLEITLNSLLYQYK